MTELSAPFASDWVLLPGESILDLAEERGWTQGELARGLGYSEKHICLLINGKVPGCMLELAIVPSELATVLKNDRHYPRNRHLVPTLHDGLPRFRDLDSAKPPHQAWVMAGTQGQEMDHG